MEFSNEIVFGLLFGFIGINGIHGINGIGGMLIKLFSYLSKYFESGSSFGEDSVLQIKEDLEDDTDEPFFDAETGSEDPSINKNVPAGNIFETFNKMKEEKILKEQRFKSIEELYNYEIQKKLSRELQSLWFEEYCLESLTRKYNKMTTQEHLETIKKLQNTVEEQRFIMAKRDNNNDEDLKILKLDMITIKNDLNTLITKINDNIIQTTSTKERNTEKSSSKIDQLKKRISILEREVTKNSSSIIGLDYSHRTMLLTRQNLEMGDNCVMLAENRFGRNPPNTVYHQPATPTSSGLTSTGCSPANSVSRPLPPPPSVISDFGPPPPPPPPPMVMTDTMASRSEVKKTGASSSLVAGPKETSQKTYCRIPITEEILRSVVLKPPGQRKAGKRILTDLM